MSACAAFPPHSVAYPYRSVAYKRAPCQVFAPSSGGGRGSNSRTSNARLPPELWLKVFEYLSHIPGICTLSSPRAIEAYSEDSDGIILYGLYDESMRLKLAISRVCWAWRQLALPLLYEYILIRSARYARVVSVALARLKCQQTDEEFYGRWIKRVEVFIYDNYWEQEGLDALADVLESAPNIRVFSDFFSPGRLSRHATRRLVATLQNKCEMEQLRRIESTGASTHLIHRLLSGTPSLEVLITKQASLKQVSFSEPGSLPLPNLHTLVVGKSDAILSYELDNLEAPNLRNLILHSNALDPLANSHPAFKSHLFSNLTHLRCFSPDYMVPRFHIPNMPGLTSLTLEFGAKPDLDALEAFRIKHHSLERITLVRFPTFSHRTNVSYDAQGQRVISEFLHSLLKRENIPSLQTIGLLRHRTYFETGDFRWRTNSRESIPYMALWEGFLGACSKRGIDVEASVGANDRFWGTWQPFHLGMVPRGPDMFR